MIDVKLTDRKGNYIASFGAGLPEDTEKEIYQALRNALRNYPKLIEVFKEK